MKAIRINEFGGPEVMKLIDIKRPVPTPDEILVKVYASGVNPADYIIRQGGNDFLKHYLKLPLGLGLEAAGIVEEVGSGVKTFKKGDQVYGVSNFLDGSYTEYLAAKASQFALKPKSTNFNEAGAIPSCALMAWNGMADFGKVQPGQRVLINGAAGGIGSLALQIAKAKGAYVIGTSSEHNFDFLKKLGADKVIEYRNQNSEELLHNIDIVFNAAPVSDDKVELNLVETLNQGGTFVSVHVAKPFSDDFKDATDKKQVRGVHIERNIHIEESLTEVAKLIDEGKVKVIVSKVYPIEKVAEAHRESETKHVRGKLVLEIRKEN